MDRLKTFIRKALVTLDRLAQIGQSKFMGTVNNYEAIHPLGFVNKVKPGALVLQFSINGDLSNTLGIEYDNKQAKEILDLLLAGEVAIFNPASGKNILMKNDGSVRMNLDKIKIKNDTGELIQVLEDLLTSLAGEPGLVASSTYTALKTIITSFKVS